MPDQFKLSSPPQDGITAVNFQPGSAQFLAAASWDCSVRLYDIAINTQRSKFQGAYPVLDCCFSDAVHVFAGGLDSIVRCYDCNTGQELTILHHDRPVRAVHYNMDTQLLISGSWDGTVRLWDTRAGPDQQPGGPHRQPDDVYTLDSCQYTLVVGTGGRHVWMWDLRQMAAAQQQRESSLKYQTRCIRCFPNAQGYALSSIEGRVAVEMFDQDPEVQNKKYAFKCHRVKEGDKELIYPVNAIAFHRKYNTFATGGSDCLVNIWDGFNRKRLMQLPKFPTSISSLAFSEDGTALAVGSSYMYEKGDLGSAEPEPNIFIRYISVHEVKPKQMATSGTQ